MRSDDDTRRLIGDLERERDLAVFRRDRIGQPGCRSRSEASLAVIAFDAVIEWLRQ